MSAPSRPLFIHSSFRTGSTWLWSKFRELGETVAFYEYFNETLSDLRPENVTYLRPDGWRSGHPETAPYFLEFLPIISDGVDGYDRKMASEWFMPQGGALRGPELDYVRSLVQLGSRAGKIPVLTETRSLGRVQPLRSEFGGFHILLVRNLYHQWCSYSNQRLNGNDYFFEQTFSLLETETDDPFLQFLSRQPRDEHDNELALFLALHLYLYARSAPFCDLIIDLNALSGSEHRWKVERSLASEGLSVDLHGAFNGNQAPESLVEAPGALRVRADALLGRALRLLPEGDAGLATRLLDEFWREQERVDTYSRPVMEQAELSAKQQRELAFSEDGYDLKPGQDAGISAASFNTQHGERKLGRIICDLGRPGYAVFGPYLVLPAGSYEVAFDYDLQGKTRPSALTLDVVDVHANQLAVRTVGSQDARTGASISFASAGGPLEFRIQAHAGGPAAQLTFYGVTLRRFRD